MRYLQHADLRQKGIRYGKPHIWKLRQLPEGDPRKFPDPIRGLGPGDTWTEPQIDEYVERQIERRLEEETALSPIDELVKQRDIESLKVDPVRSHTNP
jgi:hypothetical protein